MSPEGKRGAPGSLRGWCAVPAAVSLLCAGMANAQALANGGNPVGAEVDLRPGISAQKVTDARMADQRYADGPSLGESEKLGDDSLLRGLVSEEEALFDPLYTNTKKIKKKPPASERKIDY